GPGAPLPAGLARAEARRAGDAGSRHRSDRLEGVGTRAARRRPARRADRRRVPARDAGPRAAEGPSGGGRGAAATRRDHPRRCEVRLASELPARAPWINSPPLASWRHGTNPTPRLVEVEVVLTRIRRSDPVMA